MPFLMKGGGFGGCECWWACGMLRPLGEGRRNADVNPNLCCSGGWPSSEDNGPSCPRRGKRSEQH
eukprot:10270162-Alexandrium_andersonii.AAC.1